MGDSARFIGDSMKNIVFCFLLFCGFVANATEQPEMEKETCLFLFPKSPSAEICLGEWNKKSVEEKLRAIKTEIPEHIRFDWSLAQYVVTSEWQKNVIANGKNGIYHERGEIIALFSNLTDDNARWCVRENVLPPNKCILRYGEFMTNDELLEKIKRNLQKKR